MLTVPKEGLGAGISGGAQGANKYMKKDIF